MKKALVSLALALVLLTGAVALADYPDKPITLLVWNRFQHQL